MMDYEINPFQELYVTDTPDPNVFVQLFSNYPVQHAHALFRPGNVVLKGTQGSGKSMLLNLFRPQIRLAYHRAAVPFPVPEGLASFVGAGINLSRSGALDIGQKPIDRSADDDLRLFPLYFADFINYLIVSDLLESIAIMQETPEAFGRIVDATNLDAFASMLAKEDCWFGWLHGVSNINELRKRIDQRIGSYRTFHMSNIALEEEICRTKTAIGEPIARTAVCLRSCCVLPEGVPIFVRIDQLERLSRSDSIRPTLGSFYRQIVNKALGTRDLRVSYRIGTRQYAWEDNLVMYGSEDLLEHLRDFRTIDLNDVLSKKEDAKTWIFPAFAEDAFARRLKHAKYATYKDSDLIRVVFGPSVSPEDRAKEYCKKSSPEIVLKLESDWPEDWKAFLLNLCSQNPLGAVLAAAWARQRGTRGRPGDRLKAPPPQGAPWQKPIWRKERVQQALTQVTARAAQRMKWSGKKDIIALSSGNISIFLSICHEIWEAFLRSERHKRAHKRTDPVRDGIGGDIQAIAIHTASTFWYEKISEQRNGDDRRRFIDALGRQFRAWIVKDSAMSYPGHNGFSLDNDELNMCTWVRHFLEEAVAYGDLYSTPHTTKRKDRKHRTKWYLTPILSPVFQVPESHVKEPYYATPDNVEWWLSRAQVVFPNVRASAGIRPVRERSTGNTKSNSASPSLFDNT